MSNDNGGQAFPQAESDYSGSKEGMTLLDHFASSADVRVYGPADAYHRAYAKYPNMNELAEYVADIRYIEARAMLAERNKGTDT